ncbi:MAG: hypothetical protein M5F18_03850, partial [Asgard group archaeon]|nr:hypothetical protein [Asgard group archaeon]
QQQQQQQQQQQLQQQQLHSQQPQRMNVNSQAMRVGTPNGQQVSPISGPQPQPQPQQQPQQQPRRPLFPPAQVSMVINEIQKQNPGLAKDQVTKLAAQYLANLLQQQNRMNSQSPQPQQNIKALQQQVQQVQRNNVSPNTRIGPSPDNTNHQMAMMQGSPSSPLPQQYPKNQSASPMTGSPNVSYSEIQGRRSNGS